MDDDRWFMVVWLAAAVASLTMALVVVWAIIRVVLEFTS